MRSSTSSSSRPLTGGALATLVVLCALYGLVVRLTFPGGVPALYQQRANVITIEKWLHDGGQPTRVVVGSSMAATMSPADLGERAYNLAISSHGAQTGLEVLRRSARVPRVVLVEATGTALLPVDEELLAGPFHPATFWMQQLVPLTRHDHQPMALLDEALRRRAFRKKSDADFIMPAAQLEHRRDDLRAQQNTWTATPEVQEAVSALARRVDALTARGTRVVFFEIPRDPSLRDTAETRGVRDLLMTRFPPSRYAWILLPDWSGFRTSDGLHLIPESAARFARVLAEATAQ